MGAKPCACGMGAFLNQATQEDIRFREIIEQASHAFGELVQRGSEDEIVEALATLVGLQTLSYALLKMRGLDLEDLRARAERLVSAAVRNTTESS